MLPASGPPIKPKFLIFCNNSLLPFFRIICHNALTPCPGGADHDRHGTFGRGLRWTLAASAGSPAGRNAGLSVRQSRVVLAPRPWRQAGGKAHAATVANNAAHRGEHGISRKPIARGKPGCPGCTRGSIRVLSSTGLSHTGSAGAVGARLSLRPLIPGGQRDGTTRAKSCRGNAKVCLLSAFDVQGRFGATGPTTMEEFSAAFSAASASPAHRHPPAARPSSRASRRGAAPGSRTGPRSRSARRCWLTARKVQPSKFSPTARRSVFVVAGLWKMPKCSASPETVPSSTSAGRSGRGGAARGDGGGASTAAATTGGAGGRREAVKIGRSRVSCSAASGTAHNGLPDRGGSVVATAGRSGSELTAAGAPPPARETAMPAAPIRMAMRVRIDRSAPFTANAGNSRSPACQMSRGY